MKHELQRIISGKSQVKHGTIIQATICYLSKNANEMVKEFKPFKRQEAEILERYAIENNL